MLLRACGPGKVRPLHSFRIFVYLPLINSPSFLGYLLTYMISSGQQDGFEVCLKSRDFGGLVRLERSGGSRRRPERTILHSHTVGEYCLLKQTCEMERY